MVTAGTLMGFGRVTGACVSSKALIFSQAPDFLIDYTYFQAFRHQIPLDFWGVYKKIHRIKIGSHLVDPREADGWVNAGEGTEPGQVAISDISLICQFIATSLYFSGVF